MNVICIGATIPYISANISSQSSKELSLSEADSYKVLSSLIMDVKYTS